METVNFGEIKTFLLFGGGGGLRELALRLKQEGFEVEIFTSERQVIEEFNGVSFNDFLCENNISFETVSDINSCDKAKKLARSNSLGISFGAPWIFKKEIIDIFKGRLLNCHSRNLPKNRGGGGYSWLILNGEKNSAILLHLVDEGIDTGKIVKFYEFVFPENCRIPYEYEKYASSLESNFFNEFVKEVKTGKNFQLTTQDESKSTYFPRLHTLTQGWIDWNLRAREIISWVNAFDDPYVGASTYYNGVRVFIKKVSNTVEPLNFHSFLSGLIYRKYDNKIFVATNNGGICISEVKDEKNKDLYAIIKIGQRFFTPIAELENAKKFLPVYTHSGLKQKQ